LLINIPLYLSSRRMMSMRGHQRRSFSSPSEIGLAELISSRRPTRFVDLSIQFNLCLREPREYKCKIGHAGDYGTSTELCHEFLPSRLVSVWFARHIIQTARDWWRALYYRRRWQAAMTLAGLAPSYRGRVLVPVLTDVRTSGSVDLVTVRLVTGQAPDTFADRTLNLAHAFGAQLCRVRNASPGAVLLEFVRSDTLSDTVSALPVDPVVNLAALAVGRCEDGSPWLLRLLGSHVLIAGATGSGKGSVIWSAVRAMLPAMSGGWVQVWALDPKRMELAASRLIHRHAGSALPRPAPHGQPVRREQWRGPGRPDGADGSRFRAGRDDLPARGAGRGQHDNQRHQHPRRRREAQARRREQRDGCRWLMAR
jgi:hypothetical protein